VGAIENQITALRYFALPGQQQLTATATVNAHHQRTTKPIHARAWLPRWGSARPEKRKVGGEPGCPIWERNGSGEPLAGTFKCGSVHQDWLTSADVHKQTEFGPVCLADTEEVTGSIPVPPTQTLQVNDLTLRYANLPGPLVPIPGTAVSDSGSRS
jgi:hypothetical protein